MALLDRVTTLIKANLNDLVDKAEQPEKLLKQPYLRPRLRRRRWRNQPRGPLRNR